MASWSGGFNLGPVLSTNRPLISVESYPGAVVQTPGRRRFGHSVFIIGVRPLSRFEEQLGQVGRLFEPGIDLGDERLVASRDSGITGFRGGG